MFNLILFVLFFIRQIGHHDYYVTKRGRKGKCRNSGIITGVHGASKGANKPCRDTSF